MLAADGATSNQTRIAEIIIVLPAIDHNLKDFSSKYGMKEHARMWETL
jgi:hypothetical protein